MADIYPHIQTFLARFPGCDADNPAISKAGIVPFIPGPVRRYYVMKPHANRPELGLPEFQLCKGTRMYRTDDGWTDMRGSVPDGAELETLATTALREGIEEIGLVLENIYALYSLGAFNFASAATGKDKTMWLFASAVKKAEHFLPDKDVIEATAERTWLTLDEGKKLLRPDHFHVLGKIDAQLQSA